MAMQQPIMYLESDEAAYNPLIRSMIDIVHRRVADPNMRTNILGLIKRALMPGLREAIPDDQHQIITEALKPILDGIASDPTKTKRDISNLIDTSITTVRDFDFSILFAIHTFEESKRKRAEEATPRKKKRAETADAPVSYATMPAFEGLENMPYLNAACRARSIIDTISQVDAKFLHVYDFVKAHREIIQLETRTNIIGKVMYKMIDLECTFVRDLNYELGMVMTRSAIDTIIQDSLTTDEPDTSRLNLIYLVGTICINSPISGYIIEQLHRHVPRQAQKRSWFE